MTQQLEGYQASPNGVQRYEAIEEEEGSFGIGADEIRPPRLKYDGKLGEFTNTITGEVTKSVRLVLLRRLPKTRVKFNPDMDSAEKVQCQSVDMLRPLDPDQAAAIGAGPTCGACPFSQFGIDQYGKPVKSPCSEFVNLIVATDEEQPFPFLFGAKSTSIKPIVTLVNQLEILRQSRRARNVPGYALLFELAAGAIFRDSKSSTKTYFPLQARPLSEMIPEERLPVYSALWHMVRAAEINRAIAAEPELDEKDEAGMFDEQGNFLTPAELEAKIDSGELARPAQPSPPMPVHLAIPVNVKPLAPESEPEARSEEDAPPRYDGGALPGMPPVERSVKARGA